MTVTGALAAPRMGESPTGSTLESTAGFFAWAGVDTLSTLAAHNISESASREPTRRWIVMRTSSLKNFVDFVVVGVV